jgi:heptosyltransferase-3
MTVAGRFAAVIAAPPSAGYPVPGAQGPADAEPARRSTLLEGDATVLLQPDLPRLAAVLGAARAYLGGDSGVSHLAATVGAPSVVLFPPATARRWTPWSPTAIPVELQDGDGDVERAREALARVLG